MRHKRLCLLILALISTFFWYCSGADNPFEPNQNVVDIAIINNKFVPQQETISQGTTVRWTNNDSDFHTVDHGKPMDPVKPAELALTVLVGESAEHTFTNAGTFDYYCGRHGETGKIIVQ